MLNAALCLSEQELSPAYLLTLYTGLPCSVEVGAELDYRVDSVSLVHHNFDEGVVNWRHVDQLLPLR